MDVKLLVGGIALAGVGLGAYILANQKPQQATPAPAPSFPSPSTPAPSPVTPIADAEDLMCAQVVTKCADGSWAGTPCGCRDRGGAAKPDPATVIYDQPRPIPAPEVVAVAGGPVQTVEPLIAAPTVQPVYSDIEDRPIWDRLEGPLWS